MGERTGRSHLAERNMLIVMKLHLDGSEGDDDGGRKWMTLAGYIASDGFWRDFDDRWTTMLHNRYPVAPYIHMNELMGWDDPFERVNGWTDRRKEELILDAVKLLQSINKRAFCSFLCRIDLSGHAALIAEGASLKPPEFMCADACISQSFKWYISEHPDHLEAAHIFSDRDEPYIKEFKKEWARHQEPKRLIKPGNLWGWIASIEEVNMRETPATQACDMVAWAESRSVSDAERPYKFLSKIIQTVTPTARIILTEPTLRANFVH